MNNKEKYGEVLTPNNLVKDMLKLLPEAVFKNKNFKWLDPGAGTGNISQCIIDKIASEQQKNTSDILKLVDMIEINDEHIPTLKSKFGENANIIHGNFLEHDNKYDVICGNPPFNFNGSRKVPTASSNISKKDDGKTIWIDFTKKAISLLKPNGYLLFILPSIWLKPDKAKMYQYLTQFRIHKIHCFSNTDANKLFKNECQTPCCFFLLQKCPSIKEVLLYDKDISKYIPFYLANPNVPIPVFGASIVNLVYEFTQKIGNLRVDKSNMPSKNNEIRLLKTKTHKFKNIHTCMLDGLHPKLSFRYSSKPCLYYTKPKLVLAHGMYGFPYLDTKGKYGISNRDKFIIYDYSLYELKIIKDFLSTKFALYLFEATRYRMKFLEKYIFDLMPDIPKMPNLPTDINDDTLAEYFSLTKEQRYKNR